MKIWVGALFFVLNMWGAAVCSAQDADAQNDASAITALGDAYIQQRDYAKAAEKYEEAIRIEPLDFNRHFTLSEIYIHLRRPADADQLYRQIVVGSSDEVMILKAGRRSIALNDFAGTLDDLEKDFRPLENAVSERAVYQQILLEMDAALLGKRTDE